MGAIPPLGTRTISRLQPYLLFVDDAALSQQALSIHRQDIELSFAHQNRGGAATGFGPTDKMASSTSDMTIDDAWESVKSVVLAGWSKTTRRMRAAGAVLIFFILAILLLRPSIPEPSLPRLPSLSLDYGTDGPISPYNVSKVALLIENRVNPILAPLMLHFMSVVPPDWRFRFMGSLESVEYLNTSRAIRNHVASGKLDLTYIPANMTTGSQEEISRFLTTLWLYETVLQPAEWLLVFQTDSMLCANSRQTLNSWLDYDWVGAPWNPNGRFGGNGGLSLRRVSKIIDVLRNQQRIPNRARRCMAYGPTWTSPRRKTRQRNYEFNVQWRNAWGARGEGWSRQEEGEETWRYNESGRIDQRNRRLERWFLRANGLPHRRQWRDSSRWHLGYS